MQIYLLVLQLGVYLLLLTSPAQNLIVTTPVFSRVCQEYGGQDNHTFSPIIPAKWSHANPWTLWTCHLPNRRLCGWDKVKDMGMRRYPHVLVGEPCEFHVIIRTLISKSVCGYRGEGGQRSKSLGVMWWLDLKMEGAYNPRCAGSF